MKLLNKGFSPPSLHTQKSPYLSDGKNPLPAGYHLVPLVMQEVHEASGLVAADEFRNVGGQR